MKSNNICAPGKKLEDNTCFSTGTLKKIVEVYNKSHNDTINVNAPKHKLVDTMAEKMQEKYHCKEQTCWTRQKFLENLDEKHLEDAREYTFKPPGPSRKYGWLSTTHINDVVDQYHKVHKDFVFLGAVPYDFDDLKQLEIYNIDFAKMEKEEYRPTTSNKKFGRDAVYDMMERLFDDTKQTKEDKVKLIKTLDRTIADMESDGMYFSDEVKEKLEKEREELFCEYSGLPSPKAYETN